MKIFLENCALKWHTYMWNDWTMGLWKQDQCWLSGYSIFKKATEYRESLDTLEI